MTSQDIEQKLKELQDKVDAEFDESIEMIALSGVALNEALKNQLELQITWEMIVRKLEYLLDVSEMETETAFAEAFKKEKSNGYMDVTQSEAKEYAKADPVYKTYKRLMFDVRNLRDEAKGILDTIQSRKYILNNMTNAIVAGAENTIL